jgi:mannose/fructose/N-acetylgalactosamine-specific phosphotransferase system component IID
MYIIFIAWMYVAVMMAVAEATHAQGSVLGAIVTFLLYGLLPMAIVLYIMRTPARKEARRRAEQQEDELASTQRNTEPPSTPPGQ